MNINNIKEEYDYFIGIDFGTTYSACSYAISDNPDTIYSIKRWPRTSVLNEKVPSVIAYSDNKVPSTIYYSNRIPRLNNKPESSLKEMENASSIVDQEIFVSVDNKVLGIGNVPDLQHSIRIKHLPNSLNLSDLIPDEKNRIPSVDFLKLFHEHVIKEIRKQQGENGIKRIRYCFTLQHPSEPIYKKNLLKAIKLAGICSDTDQEDKILFMDKYIAMAKHFLKSKDFQLNHKFMIVDADSKYTKIKVMKVISIGRKVDVKELSHGITDNKLCSDRLDVLFQKYMEKTINTHPLYTKETHDEMITTTVDYFKSQMKYSLDLDDEKVVYVDLLQSQDPTPYLTLDIKDIKQQVYDPILTEIFNATSKLYKSTSANYVFLCGTLSRLPYMAQEFEKITNNLDIVFYDDMSATYGAVYQALNEKLANRRTAPICIQGASRVLEDEKCHDLSNYDYTHIIGIDFGTSFSKWYYSTIDGKSQVEFDKNLMFIPTLSLYDEGLRRQKLWGKDAFDDYYDSGESGKLMTRFKLYLDNVDKDGIDELTVLNAVANYLRSLNEKIKEIMETIFPGTFKKYRYCLTVPTIWSDRMKRMMRDTAVLASIISLEDHPSRLMLVNEPEAAAVFYANDMATDFIGKYFEINSSKTSVRALICDAGGGTVDMAVFDFHKVANSRKYSLDEVTVGMGSLCGSSFLDDAFRNLIETLCKEAGYKVSRYNIEQMVLHFITNVKESYTDTDTEDIVFYIPNEKDAIVKVTSKDMTSIVFQPTITKVIDIITNQIDVTNKTKTKIDMIVITGGLGQSMYLLNKVKELIKGKNIDVHSPKAYDQSVVRGAVDFVRNPNYIKRRIVQKSYGIEVQVPVDPESDLYSYGSVSALPEFMSFRYDNLFKANNSMKTYEYVEKKYYVAYPDSVYIAILSNHDDPTGIASSLDSRIEKVIKHYVDIPQSGFQEGDIVPIIVKLYLGQTEIKVNVVIDSENATKWAKINNRQISKQESFHNKPVASEKNDSSKLSRTTTDLSKESKPQKGILNRLKWKTK